MQVIHPFKDGQCIITIRRDSVALNTPQRWIELGYFFGNTAALIHTSDYDKVFPLTDGTRYHVKTIVGPTGIVSLLLNSSLVATGSLSSVHAIDFTIGPGEIFYAEGVWKDAHQFAGAGFPLTWQKGDTGIIVEPVDASQPTVYNRLFHIIYAPGF